MFESSVCGLEDILVVSLAERDVWGATYHASFERWAYFHRRPVIAAHQNLRGCTYIYRRLGG